MVTDLKSILKLEVPLSVQIASRNMSMREVSKLAPGAIIELPKLADEELEIVVSNQQIGVGSAVKVGENFGVRVSYIGNVKDRIRALGGIAPTTPPSGAEPETPADATPDASSDEQDASASDE